MKTLILALAVALLPFAAEAKPSKNDLRAKKIVETVKEKRAKALSQIRLLSTPLVNFYLSPAEPKVGESVTLFAQAHTGFTDQELVLEGVRDGSFPIAFEEPATELWIAELGSFTQIREHTVTASLFIRDKLVSDQIRAALLRRP